MAADLRSDSSGRRVPYTVAAVTHGSGPIAAWVAGFAFAYALRSDGSATVEVAHTTEPAEYLGGLLAMLSLLFFGAVLLGPALQHLSWRIVGYAVLSDAGTNEPPLNPTS